MKQSNRRPVAIAFALAALLALPALPSTSSACINGIRERVDYRVQFLVRAERLLRKGYPKHAAYFALRAYRGLRRVQGVSRRTPGKLRRALLVLALSGVRRHGAVDQGPGHHAKTASERVANLRWSRKTIARLLALRPRSPRLRAAHGEALSTIASKRGKARSILEKLAKRDLLGSANAYAVLARLRALGGDSKGTKAAIARCRRIAGRRSHVCRMPAIAAGGKPIALNTAR